MVSYRGDGVGFCAKQYMFLTYHGVLMRGYMDMYTCSGVLVVGCAQQFMSWPLMVYYMSGYINTCALPGGMMLVVHKRGISVVTYVQQFITCPSHGVLHEQIHDQVHFALLYTGGWYHNGKSNCCRDIDRAMNTHMCQCLHLMVHIMRCKHDHMLIGGVCVHMCVYGYTSWYTSWGMTIDTWCWGGSCVQVSHTHNKYTFCCVCVMGGLCCWGDGVLCSGGGEVNW